MFPRFSKLDVVLGIVESTWRLAREVRGRKREETMSAHHTCRTSFPLIVFMAAALASTACRMSSTEFRNGENSGFQLDADINPDPTTVGGEDAGAGLDLRGPGVNEATWVPTPGDFVLVDHQTGSLWNVRGEAFAGPLAGHQLAQIPAFNSFWFAWSVFYHGSELWSEEQPNQTAPLQPDRQCLVPCDEIRLACGGGKDCIPALDFDGRDGRPVAKMVAADEAGYLDPSAFVFGVAIDGEARAYPHNIFWWHEIYNDRIGETEFSVTFCPLTGSGMVFAGRHDGGAVDFGVSGNLYNSNLVMFDRQSDTLWSQMIYTAISGDRIGERLTLLPVVETTWARWTQMYPDTLVASNDTGYSRSYDSYPYGSYRTDHSNTFRDTNPSPDPRYPNKSRVLGLPTASPRAYAMAEMHELGDRVVINDTYDDRSIVVLYEHQHRMAIPFWAEVDGHRLTFRGSRAP